MKFREKKVYISILLAIFIFSLYTPVNASPNLIIRETTTTLVADMDTYVNSALPTSNFGNIAMIRSGSDNDSTYEAYYHFNLTSKPAGVTKAEFSYHQFGWPPGPPILNISVYLIEESWSENTTTWNNKPSKADKVGTILTDQGNINLKTNITDVIDGKSEISFCVFIENSKTYVGARETVVEGNEPMIIWTFTENAEINVLIPGSSSVWSSDAGSSYTDVSIQWSSIGTIDKVNIELFKGGNHLIGLALETDNDGEHNFNINTEIFNTGDDYQVKVYDSNDPNVYGFSENFTIRQGVEVPDFGPIIIIAALAGAGAAIVVLFVIIRKRKKPR